MVSIKIGDYVDIQSVDTLIAYQTSTINRVIDVDYSLGCYLVEYYYDTHRRKSIIDANHSDLFVLTESDPRHKILIDRFNIAKMQSIIET